ncbi:hypothetical protein C5Y96_03790 [Blastopirellula marina]|uniref:Uncharacterized protein n=2 Tax=Pirellulales TaxID=2691354 RepID=A0A2S8G3H1_9BACT|nr:hypothetical protein C5Y96_03790 [Blastopirellula marina]RCS55310.1 hypothetical protein DTL36_03795 [Bremerella cremea]
MLDLTEFAAGSVGIGLIAVVCWFAFVPVLEFLSRTIRSIVARNTDPKQWDEVLYVSLKPAALLAIPGMILWIIWVTGFYFLGANFFVISYAVGIPSHILAACLYVPLLYRWYKLWDRSVPRPDSEASSTSLEVTPS